MDQSADGIAGALTIAARGVVVPHLAAEQELSVVGSAAGVLDHGPLVARDNGSLHVVAGLVPLGPHRGALGGSHRDPTVDDPQIMTFDKLGRAVTLVGIAVPPTLVQKAAMAVMYSRLY